MSLTNGGSSTDAAFGGESAGGDGTPESDVTHSGTPPCAFAAVQPAGSAGGLTPSKSSEKKISGDSVIVAVAEPEPTLSVVMEAVLLNTVPHVPLEVSLTTCACVLVPPARLVGLYSRCWFGGDPVTDQPLSLAAASRTQLTLVPEGRSSLKARPVAVTLPMSFSATV